jgi:predicted RNase H-like nuclease
MRAVLGIDAAWTLTEPSGVALVSESDSGWRLTAVAGSYKQFQALADGTPAERIPTGSKPDPRALLAAAAKLAGAPVELVAVDMPMARTPIVGRRASDDAVSKAYGSRWCGTHTPSALRPGPVSDALRESFTTAGYALLTDRLAPPGVIEVYPHPALVELASATYRLPYKASKVRAYWRDATPQERRSRLFRQWHAIVMLLEPRIAAVASALPIPDPAAKSIELKAYEDQLDAVICAWVAVAALSGAASPFGDENSSIWIPTLCLNGIKHRATCSTTLRRRT